MSKTARRVLGRAHGPGLTWLLTTVCALLCAGSAAGQRVEEVYVEKVLSDDDKAIVVRSNGESHLIEKGVGCLSLWRFEGKKALISSPSRFLGVGSRLILPDADQDCRIWDSQLLGRQHAAEAPGVEAGYGPRMIEDVQRALAMLGSNPGIADGHIGPQTEAALKTFQQSANLTRTGLPDRPTRIALGNALGKKFPQRLEALDLALRLIRQGDTMTDCDSRHWISSVMDAGGVVKVENESLWEIDPVGRVDTMLWLPVEEVAVCGTELINTDTGDRVAARRIR